jgi:hypothetical protein
MIVTRISAEGTRFKCEFCGETFEPRQESREDLEEMEEHTRNCAAEWDDTNTEEMLEDSFNKTENAYTWDDLEDQND